jgi:3-O-methylgallate 3,4-dioxygenase
VVIMAEITLGVGSSHGPMLSTPPDKWGMRAEADRVNRQLWYAGRQYSFAELLRERGGPDAFAAEIGPDRWRQRHRRCADAIEGLRIAIDDAAPDVIVIVTDDQREMFGPDLQPSLGVFVGDAVAHLPLGEDELAQLPPGIAVAHRGFTPSEPVSWPCAGDLAHHIVAATRDRFDLAISEELPAGRHGNHAAPHGYGFVFETVLRDLSPPKIPVVPVFLNSFYPPNQPSAARCVEFGIALREAIEGYPGDRRVAVLASGGLTHFVIEEDFDRAFLKALADGDLDYVRSIPDERLQSGTSEMRNWFAVAGALLGGGLRFELIDYVPCYRSEAGTGNAMGFAIWR